LRIFGKEFSKYLGQWVRINARWKPRALPARRFASADLTAVHHQQLVRGLPVIFIRGRVTPQMESRKRAGIEKSNNADGH